MKRSTIQKEEKNIILNGFMGVGKTTIARNLANSLNRPFIDIDKEIKKEFQMSIPKIFAEYGEGVFREKEKELILTTSTEKGKIISVGGGAFLQDDIKKNCLENGIVIFLETSWENWKNNRLPFIRRSRPILHGKTMKEIRELFEERQAIYNSYHIKVKTDYLMTDEIVNEVLHLLKLYWQ